MTDTEPTTGAGKDAVGQITWADLTVADAEKVRDFYSHVVGWRPTEFKTTGDYCMDLPDSGKTVAGICHARGVNADLPPVWLIYINVSDLDESMRRCVEQGGRIHVEPRGMGAMGRYCVIQDPSGAFAALVEPARL